MYLSKGNLISIAIILIQINNTVKEDAKCKAKKKKIYIFTKEERKKNKQINECVNK